MFPFCPSSSSSSLVVHIYSSDSLCDIFIRFLLRYLKINQITNYNNQSTKSDNMIFMTDTDLFIEKIKKVNSFFFIQEPLLATQISKPRLKCFVAKTILISSKPKPLVWASMYSTAD